jgi:Family of unknown function (DUF5995)
MKETTSIPEVIACQENIINLAIAGQNAAGYFAVLYQKMTLAVQAAITASKFEDGLRMQKLIIHFAGYYLQAWDGYQNKQTIGPAWQQVFSACENKNLVVLQHLILGINTHINLDLAKAAVQTCPGQSIHALQADFEKINTIIASLVQEVQTSLEKIWWPLKLLTDITNNRHKAVLNFSINTARKTSWANALALSVVQGDMQQNHLTLMEGMVTSIGKKIINPGVFTSLLLKPVLWMEDKPVSKLISILKEKTNILATP